MEIHSPSELERLSDEIAELSAHLDAATARLLALIRRGTARSDLGDRRPAPPCPESQT
jgi:hypothetical protein